MPRTQVRRARKKKKACLFIVRKEFFIRSLDSQLQAHFFFLPLNIGNEPIPSCDPTGSAHWEPWETARNLPQLFHLKEQAWGGPRPAHHWSITAVGWDRGCYSLEPLAAPPEMATSSSHRVRRSYREATDRACCVFSWAVLENKKQINKKVCVQLKCGKWLCSHLLENLNIFIFLYFLLKALRSPTVKRKKPNLVNVT